MMWTAAATVRKLKTFTNRIWMVSTVSTVPYTQSDESVEVLAKTLVTEQSTTIPYSQSDESIQFLLEEEKQDEKESEENNVTDVTDEKEDIEDGQESDVRGKDSVDKEAVSQGKDTVDIKELFLQCQFLQ